MQRHLTMEYWIDDGWYVGRLVGIPGVFSQGESLEELEENIRDAYILMMETEDSFPEYSKMTKDILVDVA